MQKFIIYKGSYLFGAEINISADVNTPTIIGGDTFSFFLRSASETLTSSSTAVSGIKYTVDFPAETVLAGATKFAFKINNVGGWFLYKNGNADPIATGTISNIIISNVDILNVGFMVSNSSVSGPITTPTYSNIVFQITGTPAVPEETTVSILPGQNLQDFYKAAARENIGAIGVEDYVDMQPISEKGEANGYVPLDEDAKIPSEFMPDGYGDLDGGTI